MDLQAMLTLVLDICLFLLAIKKRYTLPSWQGLYCCSSLTMSLGCSSCLQAFDKKFSFSVPLYLVFNFSLLASKIFFLFWLSGFCLWLGWGMFKPAVCRHMLVSSTFLNFLNSWFVVFMHFGKFTATFSF